MYTRLFLLALGWRTTDPYEREGGKAVRAYLIALLLPCALLMGVLLLCAYVFTGHIALSLMVMLVPLIAFVVPVTPDRYEVSNIKLMDYDIAHSRIVDALCATWNARPVPVYQMKSKLFYAETTTLQKHPHITLSSGLVAILGHPGTTGILAHELAHIMLPCGGRAFKCLRRCFTILPDFLLQFAFQFPKSSCAYVVYKLTWFFSTNAPSHMREYACDVLGAMMLRDAGPLLVSLAFIARQPEGSNGSLASTHPHTGLRIRRLHAFETAVGQSRT